MTQKRYTEIPKRQKCINKEEPYIGGAKDILDDELNKPQSQINDETNQRVSTLEESVGTGGSVDERIATAKSEVIGDAGTDYDTLGKLEDKLQEEVANRASQNYTKSETYNKTELNNLITTPNQEYVTVTATDQTTAVTDVLPASGEADTVYRVGNWNGTQYSEVDYAEYAWNGSTYIKLSTKSQIGEVYDISANHADTKYADLSAALGVDGANIPQSLRRGGMSIKYVQSSDNKYVQYRLTSDTFTTTASEWQKQGAEVTVSQNILTVGNNITGMESVHSFGYSKREYNLTPGTNHHPYELQDFIPINLKSGDSIRFVSSLSAGSANRYMYLRSGSTWSYWASLPYGDITTTIPSDADAIGFLIENPSANAIFSVELFIDEALAIRNDIKTINTHLNSIDTELDSIGRYKYDTNNVFVYDTCNLSSYISNIRMTFETLDAYRSMLMPNGCFRRFAFRNINPNNGNIVIYYENDNGIIDPQLVNISGQNWMTTKYAYGTYNGVKVEIYFKEIPTTQLYPIDAKNVWNSLIPIKGYIDLLNRLDGVYMELLPIDSRLDALTTTDGETAGLWALRNTEQGQSITKNGDYFTIVLKAGVTNDAFWILDYPVFRELIGKRVDITFKYRSNQSFYFLLGDNSNKVAYGPSDTWREVVYSKIMIDPYNEGKIMIYDNFQSDATIDLKDFSVKTSFLNERDVIDNRITTLAGRVTALENAAGDINLVMRNFHYKIASIEREESKQCIIGLIGDSWTQHSGASYLTGHSNYVQPLTKYLRTKYGNAGGGFYSFSISHIDDPELQKMGCADPDDATDERSSSGITYQDQVAGTKWVDAADAIFGNGTYLILNILTAHDKLVIHFWGAADAGTFTYSLDNGTPVSVDASEYTGHSMIEISTTDTTHTLRFDVTSGSVMLFGVDMQRTARGVRVHKFGNKGATSNSFVIADADAWKAGFESLNIDSCTLLMGINEPNSQMTIYNNYLTIIGRIKDVNPYCDICVIQPSGGKLYDLSTQSIYQRNAAIYENTGFLNLIPLFGSREQITAKGTFMSDGIHPTLAGGRMIADYIEDKIFF